MEIKIYDHVPWVFQDKSFPEFSINMTQNNAETDVMSL